MSITRKQIKELLDTSRTHDCDGIGPDHGYFKVAAILFLLSGESAIIIEAKIPLQRNY